MEKKIITGDEPAMPHGGFEERGLTIRQYFAAMAMQGLLANSDYQTNISDGAVKCADALIAELNK